MSDSTKSSPRLSSQFGSMKLFSIEETKFKPTIKHQPNSGLKKKTNKSSPKDLDQLVVPQNADNGNEQGSSSGNKRKISLAEIQSLLFDEKQDGDQNSRQDSD